MEGKDPKLRAVLMTADCLEVNATTAKHGPLFVLGFKDVFVRFVNDAEAIGGTISVVFRVFQKCCIYVMYGGLFTLGNWSKPIPPRVRAAVASTLSHLSRSTYLLVGGGAVSAVQSAVQPLTDR